MVEGSLSRLIIVSRMLQYLFLITIFFSYKFPSNEKKNFKFNYTSIPSHQRKTNQMNLTFLSIFHKKNNNNKTKNSNKSQGIIHTQKSEKVSRLHGAPMLCSFNNFSHKNQRNVSQSQFTPHHHHPAAAP